MKTQDRLDILEPLLHGLVHEIRNPVQGILASADALRFRYEEDVTGNRLLEMIQRECVRIDRLLTDLLALSRPVIIDRTAAQPLSWLLEESIRNLRQQNNSVQLTIDIPERLRPIYMDQQSIRTAINALLQNAFESKEKDVAIRIVAEDLGDQICIRIEDNGEGIVPEGLDRVLEPFFSTRPKKAGLGLSIAERNVRLHGGQLQIDSQRGAGTVVTMRLPVGP